MAFSKQLGNQKDKLRQLGRRSYPQAQEEQEKFCGMVVEGLLGQPVFHSAQQIGLFSPLLWEVDLLGIWEEMPEKVVFPKVVLDKQLAFAFVRALSELKLGYGHVKEPPLNESTLAKPWRAGDIILVPGLAFDAFGGRVGSGQGYYDRFLGGLPEGVQKWGVCWEAQVAGEKLFQTETDVRMDYLVSEKGIRACRG